ncbi:MAG: aspartate-semialdehyde dehydrogenase [Acidobacteriota bacterium]|nr:aspartate-semialdehyde dehydrogenase [Acidobacteriota bacterium]
MGVRPRIPVAVLGATGTVGQRFITLLAEHPWFEIRALTASDRSTGKHYKDAVQWMQESPLPSEVASMVLLPTQPDSADGCRLAFSALASSVATEAEIALASAGILVVSNAGSHRMDPDVPLVVPEVNPDHLELATLQKFDRGAILTNPNCSTIGLVLPLKPLDDLFGVEAVHVVTMQALSGAGMPGVPGMRSLDNVVPWIPREEEKVEQETCKILGRLTDTGIDAAPVRVSAACNRVPVLDGHLACVSVSLRKTPPRAELEAAWRSFRGEPQTLALPTAPPLPVIVLEGDDVPQPRLHRGLGGGMAASVGRLRSCPLLDFRFVTLSHNTLRGAAGGALLLAELAVRKGIAGVIGADPRA